MSSDSMEDLSIQQLRLEAQRQDLIRNVEHTLEAEIKKLNALNINASIVLNIFDEGRTPVGTPRMVLSSPGNGSWGMPLNSTRLQVSGTNTEAPTPPEVNQIHESVPVTRAAFNELQETVRLFGERLNELSSAQKSQSDRIDQACALGDVMTDLRKAVTALRREIERSRGAY